MVVTPRTPLVRPPQAAPVRSGLAGVGGISPPTTLPAGTGGAAARMPAPKRPVNPDGSVARPLPAPGTVVTKKTPTTVAGAATGVPARMMKKGGMVRKSKNKYYKGG